MNKEAFLKAYKEARIMRPVRRLKQSLMPRQKRMQTIDSLLPRSYILPADKAKTYAAKVIDQTGDALSKRTGSKAFGHMDGPLWSRLLDLLWSRSGRLRDMTVQRQGRAAMRASKALSEGRAVNPKTLQSLKDTNRRLDFVDKVDRADTGRMMEGSLWTSAGILGHDALKDHYRDKPKEDWKIQKRRREQEKQGPWQRK